MKTVTALENLAKFINDGTPRAPYTFDGGKTHKNAGQAKEILAKSVRGLALNVQSGKDFTKEADLQELNVSVKSAEATIPHVKGTSYVSVNEYADSFTANDCANSYIYAMLTNTHYIEYTLSKALMNKFIKRFGTLKGDVVRLPKDSKLVTAWLETNTNR